MTAVAFRLDAGPAIGLGHAMRCMALADALKSRGARTVFAAALLPDVTAESLRARGHEFAPLAAPADAFAGDPESEWSAPAQQDDAAASAKALARFGPLDWIVVDSYRLGRVWQRAMVGAARHLAVIDDNARRAHDCDLLIDHNVSAAHGQYEDRLPLRAMQLLGPRFALLRAEFARRVPPRTGVTRVLVALGGADATHETEKALDALAAPPLQSLAVDVVVGAANPRLDAIRARAARRGAAVHVDSERVAELMERADVALGAAGVSALERCAKALPSLLIVVADNQAPTAAALADCGAALLLGSSSDVDADRIARALAALAALPDLVRRMSERAAEVCDGQGARRAAARLLGFDVRLRPANTADSDDVLAWRNDETARRYAMDPGVIDAARHAAWFAERMNDRDGALLIGEDDRGPVGVLRFDVRGDAARVSVYLAPGRHGEGLGPVLLHAGQRWLRAQRPAVRRIDADVLAGNRASQLAFAEAGYIAHHATLQRHLRTADSP